MHRAALLLLLLALPTCSGGSGEAQVRLRFGSAAVDANIVFQGDVAATFAGATLVNQQTMQRNMGNGAAVGDYDGDGDLDVYLLGHLGEENRLFRNDLDLGTKTFTDVTPPLLADMGLSRVAHFVDLDDDGDLDLLLINDDDGDAGTPPSKIFENQGDGTFTDATAGSGFAPVGYLRCGCAIADYDRDGLLDIYVTNWGYDLGSGTADFPGANVLYRNLGGLQFEDVTAAVGLDGLAHDSFTAIFTDFDDDGYPDLHVAVDHASDVFYRNDAGTFVNVTTEVGATHTGNDMGVACADFDDDGDLDLYATNITDASTITGTTQGNVLYVNLQSQTGSVLFVDRAAERGCFDTYWGWGVEFFDPDNDGDLDIAAVNGFDEFLELNFGGPASPVHGTPGVFLRNDGSGNFRREALEGFEAPDDGRALIAFDYDRDGDVDLLTTNVRGPVRLLENRTETDNRWLHVVLAPDRLAIGARVYAETGEKTRRRDVICGRSFLAGTPSEVHFGLGKTETVDRLVIRWNDGTETVMNDVASNQILRVTAP